MKAAYIYALKQTSAYLHKPLKSTGMQPHFSVAVDKSTPHRDTNQAIMVLVPFKGTRHSMPIDAPLVYKYSKDDDAVQGGSGRDLANQIFDVMKNNLQLHNDDFHFLRGRHNFFVISRFIIVSLELFYKPKEENPRIRSQEVGTMLKVKTVCRNLLCPKRINVWKSQPEIAGTNIPAGNLLICFATLPKLKYSVFSLEKLFPAIYSFWCSYQIKLLAKLREAGEEIVISEDARHDSMGHSAKYGAYTVFCCNTSEIIHSLYR